MRSEEVSEEKEREREREREIFIKISKILETCFCE